MTPSPRVWIATFAALVFLIGALAGVVVDRSWLLPRGVAAPLGPGPGSGRGMGGGGGGGMGAGRGGPVVMLERVIGDLDAELQLSAEQEKAIGAILDGWRPRVQALQDSARKEFVTAQEQLQAEIAKALTPEQAKRFAEMNARLLEGGRGPRGGLGRGRGRNN